MSTLNQGPRGPHCQPGTLSRQRNSCVRDLKKLIYFSTFFDGVDVADQRSFAVPVLVAVHGVVDGRVVDLLHGRRQLLQLLGVDLGSKQRVNRDTQVAKGLRCQRSRVQIPQGDSLSLLHSTKHNCFLEHVMISLVI